MKIILATGNKGKIKEFKYLMPDDNVVAYTDIVDEFEIVENGDTFAKNAIIKAKAVDEKINKLIDEPYIIISDDSGISVPILDNEPGIYSARYASENATDKENLNKLINKLNKKNITKTPAYYTACICIIYEKEIYTVHGWMYGDVINKDIGNEGFGYDGMFIPEKYDKTLGELNKDIKKSFSHRSKALLLAKRVLALFA
jgi:XTP/dITP diphosphohydrolase